MLTPRENALKMIYNEKPEYIPMSLEYARPVGMPLQPAIESPLFAPGYDAYGVYWNMTELGTIPDNRTYMLDDINDWEKVVKVPDISNVDFKGIAEKELETCDRSQTLLTVYHLGGIWDRMVSFMGYETAMISLMEEPETCMKLLEVITDYKVRCAEKLMDVYSPDIYMDFCDYATASSLFMSPATWREIFKPFQQRLIDCVTSRGILYQQHTCGKCEAIIPDYVEMGVRLWHSAQSMNDLAGIEEKYLGKLTVEGGWDSSGKPGMITATDEDIINETKRCLEEYGHSGGYILLPALMSEEGNSVLTGRDKRLPALMDTYMKYRAL